MEGGRKFPLLFGDERLPNNISTTVGLVSIPLEFRQYGFIAGMGDCSVVLPPVVGNGAHSWGKRQNKQEPRRPERLGWTGERN